MMLSAPDGVDAVENLFSLSEYINESAIENYHFPDTEMSAVQSACIAHRNGEANGYPDEGVVLLDVAIDANGDPVKDGNGLKVSSSSDEDLASCSSKDEEDEGVITLKTR